MSYPNDLFYRWFPDEPNHHTGFHQIVSALLPAKGKILDLGCGDNDLLGGYRYPGREIWGVDFDAHPTLKHAEWFRLLNSGGTIPFANATFDCVTSFMVMEHVAAPKPFFDEVTRVLKPGGVYVGQSIHAEHYVTWIRRLFDLVPHSWVQRLVKTLYGREEHDTFPTCYRLNTRRAIAKAARASGLERVAWRGYASQGYFLFSNVSMNVAIVTDGCLEMLRPGLGKIYFTVVLRKPAESVTRVLPIAAAA